MSASESKLPNSLQPDALASVVTDDELNEKCKQYAERFTHKVTCDPMEAAHDFAQGAYWMRRQLAERGATVQSEGSPSPLGSTLDEARAHRRQNPEYVEAENRIAALARKLAETHGCSETDTDEDVDEFFQQHRDEYEGLAVTALSWLAEQALTLPRVERSDSDEDLIYVRLRSGEVANTDEECCNVESRCGRQYPRNRVRSMKRKLTDTDADGNCVECGIIWKFFTPKKAR